MSENEEVYRFTKQFHSWYIHLFHTFTFISFIFFTFSSISSPLAYISKYMDSTEFMVLTRLLQEQHGAGTLHSNCVCPCWRSRDGSLHVWASGLHLCVFAGISVMQQGCTWISIGSWAWHSGRRSSSLSWGQKPCCCLNCSHGCCWQGWPEPQQQTVGRAHLKFGQTSSKNAR